STNILGGPVTVPAPSGSVRPSGPTNTDADGHLVLYHSNTSTSYDYWQATTALDSAGHSTGGGHLGTAILEAGAVDFFDVRGSGSNPDGLSSATAVGAPLLAGKILPEDIQAGAINHALAFAIPRPRNTNTSNPYEPLKSDYFYPAATTETDFYNSNPQALASGQRIRLKQTLIDEEDKPINESTLAPITRIFLTALRNYGAYLMDNSDGFVFYAEDIHTANLTLSDQKVNELIGQPSSSSLPQGKTKWQIVIEKLNLDLETIALASGPWWEYGNGGKDPATATYNVSNFEVVEPATAPNP
ncbi:MAG: hypothetical protein ACYTF1_27195, partial [Planctomycetota bacterium]